MTDRACPRCGRPFDTIAGLDAHRRRRRACAYRPNEPTAAWRPGLLALPGPRLGGRLT